MKSSCGIYISPKQNTEKHCRATTSQPTLNSHDASPSITKYARFGTL